VHEGASPDPPQQGQGRVHRERRYREEGDLRRRAGAPPQRGEPSGPQRRSHGREIVAGPVTSLRKLSVGGRFRAAYFALAALFGAAIGAFVVVERAPAPVPPPPWSAWQPTGANARVQVRQIAAHVGAQYHLSRGKKLVEADVGSPIDPSTTISAVAVAKTTRPQKNSDFSFFDPSSTAMFTLCGDPKLKCAIKDGKPSEARGALVEREAFELALYTLRYVNGA